MNTSWRLQTITSALDSPRVLHYPSDALCPLCTCSPKVPDGEANVGHAGYRIKGRMSVKVEK